jgi:hypothetical protein
VNGGEERIIAVRRIAPRQGDRAALPSWAAKLEDWVRRHAVPFGTVQARMTVEYQHGQVGLIRLCIIPKDATEEVIVIAPTQRAQGEEIMPDRYPAARTACPNTPKGW